MRNVLSKSSYKGSELENEVLTSNKIYTFADLSTIIQASDDELKNALKEIGAFEIDGIDIIHLKTIVE